MPVHSDKLLQSAIDQLQINNSNLNHNYDQMRVKIIAFFGAGLATLTFLYSNDDPAKRLFFPSEFYGQVFYCIGLTSFLLALVLLFLALKSVQWYYPTEMDDMSKFDYKSNNEFLEYLKDEHIQTIKLNEASYEKKQKYLTISSNLLIIGAIILVVLNQFGDIV